MDIAAKRAAFRALHETGCFIIPNPWDRGSARQLEDMGFKALASTSAGYALSRGRQDGELSRDEVLAHLKDLCDATQLPINADFEAGFADEPEGVAASVSLAIDTGVAGLSIEDRTGRELYTFSLAVERMRAARQAIDASGHDVLLVGRSEGFLVGRTNLNDTIDRLTAYADAGADCLYAPGITDMPAIRAIVKSVAPKSVNVLLSPELNVAELGAAGVRRVSVGSRFARFARAALEEAALSVRDTGRLPR
jgi:2-methylisocitrate lyase-like PEP mutase family enzyme